MCLVLGTERLGSPLANSICAYRGGTAWRLLLLMQELVDAVPMKKRPKGLPPRQKPTGIDLVVLEKEQHLPPNAVLLQAVEGVKGVSKFTPKVELVEGVPVIEIPLNSPAMKPKRQRVTAGMIYAMVWRGNSWKDRSGHVHKEPY